MPRAPATRRSLLAAIGGGSLAAGCLAPRTDTGGTPTGTPPGGPIDHAPPSAGDWTPPTNAPPTDALSPTVLVENLKIPWDLAFAPDGDVFLTERVGRVRRFDGDDLGTVVEPADAIDAGAIPAGSDDQPWWVAGGEGGTMGIALDPRYPDPAFLYVLYTAIVDEDQHNRVVRYDVAAPSPGETATPIVDDIALRDTDAYIHRGGRLRFGPRNYLWITTGDGGFGYAPDNDRPKGYRAQRLDSTAGKILRVDVDGSPAPDNPELGSAADPRIFSYGHRNPQGIDWLPDATPIAAEHGPSRDEVNRLEAGGNYGWPSAHRADAVRTATDVHPPLVNTAWGRTATGDRTDGNNTWAPSGCTFTGSDAPDGFGHRLLIGGLISQRVVCVTLNRPTDDLPPLGEGGRRYEADWLDDRFVATAHPRLQDVLGRVRHVAQGPDGALYAITSNRDGRARDPFPRERDDVLVRLDLA